MLGKGHVCAPLCLFLWNTSSVHVIDDGSLSSFQERLSSTLSFHTLSPPDDWLRDVLGFVLLVVSQAPQHFQCSEAQAMCRLLCSPVCLLISLHSGMYRAVHPHAISKLDIKHWHLPVGVHNPMLCSKFIESVRMMACVVWLLPSSQRSCVRLLWSEFYHVTLCLHVW